MCIYELYCENLKEKALLTHELFSLDESDEMNGTTWKAYDLNNLS